MKKCSKCGQVKPLTEFTRDKSKKCGHKSACKDCLKTSAHIEYQKQYREDHAEYFKEKHAEFRSRNREKLRSQRQQYYDSQKAHEYYERDRKNRLAYAKRYRHTEKGRAAATLHRVRRRAGIKTGAADITLQAVYNRDGGRCKLCGGLCDFGDYTIKDGVTLVGNDYPSIDHIKPLSRGGAHAWDNVQLAHMQCNRVKSNKL